MGKLQDLFQLLFDNPVDAMGRPSGGGGSGASRMPAPPVKNRRKIEDPLAFENWLLGRHDKKPPESFLSSLSSEKPAPQTPPPQTEGPSGPLSPQERQRLAELRERYKTEELPLLELHEMYSLGRRE